MKSIEPKIKTDNEYRKMLNMDKNIVLIIHTDTPRGFTLVPFFFPTDLSIH